MQFFAKDIMTDNLITARIDMTCEEAAQLMTLNRVTGLPVVNLAGALVGVITQSDIIRSHVEAPAKTDYFYLENIHPDSGDEPEAIETEEDLPHRQLESLSDSYVDDNMSQDVFTAFPDTPVEELADTMYRNKIHRIIILKPNSQTPLGIVTTFDMLKLLAETSKLKEKSAA